MQECVFLCEQVGVCTCVCAKEGRVVATIEEKYPRRGEGLDPGLKTSPSVSFMLTPSPCTHTLLTPVFTQTEAPVPPEMHHWTCIRGNLVSYFLLLL